MTVTATDLVVPLGPCDVAVAGRKAAVLGELAAAGFPVPDGAVLTTAALAHTLAAAGLDGSATPAQVGAVALPAPVATAIEAIGATLGTGPFAVRSSGVDEDGVDASFAGQFVTVLGVDAAGLAAAVRRCWASAFDTPARTYRPGAEPRMAVLVQRLVPADAAGVAFTADPVTGDRATTLVSAVRGLGDRLVDGAVSPDEWVVRAGTATARRTPDGVLDADRACAVAALAHRVQAHFGVPQDVEWALAGGRLALLQARPITALPDPAPEPVPVPVAVPPGFWEREEGHSPTPMTPMWSSLYHEPRNRAMRAMFDTFGFLVETIEFADIGGWDYLRLRPVGGTDRPAPPAFLMPLLLRAVPAMRRRVRTMVATARADTAANLVRRWYDGWHDELVDRTTALRAIDLTTLDDAGLRAHLDRARALFIDGLDAHFLLHGAIAPALGDLVFTCRDVLGWPESRTFDLLSGLSAASTRPAHRLAELAGHAPPAVRALLTRVDTRTADRLAAADPAFAAELAAYTHEFGCRAIRYEIADPTVAERPELTLQLLADQLARGYDPAAEVAALARVRARTLAEAREELAGHPGADRERFERALVRAERAYPVREDNEAVTFSAPLAVLRALVLELGRRLAERGRLRARDDVFLLRIDEATAGLGRGDDLSALVTRRRGERAWIEQHPGPASYGTPPGPPPPLDALPTEARFTMEALLWYVEQIFAAAPSHRRQHVGGSIDGIAASAGRYTGPVCVVRDERDFGKVRAGDVVVCPVTSPVWSVLFPSVGALVTDTGGLLSHPAIIAREYRVPAVLATGNATTLLRDGVLVTVDGSAGTVQAHDQESPDRRRP